MTVADLPILSFESTSAWRKWLDNQHGSAAGVWLKIAKKDAGVVSVTYDDALSVALCYGWIDGQKHRSRTAGGYSGSPRANPAANGRRRIDRRYRN
jgi:uncharacterized protein YdeI (YjbR/CyaY-like superfamily)